MNDNKTFDCKLCNLKFKAPSLLKIHLGTKGHLAKEELPILYKCIDCQKEYKRCENYIYHRLFKIDCIFQCSYQWCCDEFTTKQRLVSHCNTTKKLCGRKLKELKEKLNGDQKVINHMVGVKAIRNLIKNDVRCTKKDILEYYKNNPLPSNIKST